MKHQRPRLRYSSSLTKVMAISIAAIAVGFVIDGIALLPNTADAKKSNISP